MDNRFNLNKLRNAKVGIEAEADMESQQIRYAVYVVPVGSRRRTRIHRADTAEEAGAARAAIESFVAKCLGPPIYQTNKPYNQRRAPLKKLRQREVV